MKRIAYRIPVLVAVAVVLLLGGAAYRAWATVTFTGAVTTSFSGLNSLSGNETGTSTFSASYNHNLSTGATTPDIVAGGGYSGTFTCTSSGGLLNLADSTNICKTNATVPVAPAQGYVITAAKKLRVLYLENLDTTNTVTVTVSGSNGLAGLTWSAGNTIAVLQPGGACTFTFPNGSSTLTAGTNDAITCTASAGTPQVKICGIFG